MSALGIDPLDVRRARGASGLLREFNDAAVLAAADVHVARRLAELGGEGDEAVSLAVALAVRAPRIGHVLVDLATIRDTATVDADEPVDLSVLPWPPVDGWLAAVAASPLVGTGEDGAGLERPLRLAGSRLYLDRYWREERQVAADLLTLGEHPPAGVREDVLADGLARLFPEDSPRLFADEDGGPADTRQAQAAAAAVRRRLAVIAGGPGTGKTTTVARIVALLAEQAAAAGAPAPVVGLAAPTGKAAARLEEAVHEEAASLDVAPAVREQLLGLEALTLHRLLGWRPGSHSRFRHHRGQRLPHDVVIVDETSMVSLSLMARLVEAVRPEARLILLGDPAQLVSIEAGAVLGDVVGPAALAPAAGPAGPPATDAPEAPVAAGIVVLDRVHRFGGTIARVAAAIRAGDADAVLEVLGEGAEDVAWIPVDAEAPPAEPPGVREEAVAAGSAMVAAARAGDAGKAIRALGTFRVLCAHRRGPQGVATWTSRIEGWLAEGVDEFSPGERWFAGRPVLVTENDYELRLYNGDTGVVVQAHPERLSVAFERRAEILEFSPATLGAVETVYAMTIHKSQGSQFDTAAVLLPEPGSRLLTRELLYTAATRARRKLILVGTDASVRDAVERPVARASGLRERLWGGDRAVLPP